MNSSRCFDRIGLHKGGHYLGFDNTDIKMPLIYKLSSSTDRLRRPIYLKTMPCELYSCLFSNHKQALRIASGKGN